MMHKLGGKFLAACAALLMSLRLLAADTNESANAMREDLANHFLQLQEQIHATQLALEQNQEAALETAQSNALVLAARLRSLEDSVTQQRASDTDAARRTQQLMLIMIGGFALAGVGFMLLMAYFQWRAFAQIAQLTAQSQTALANAGAVHQLAAPGRAAVEVSNARLLDVVGHLEKKILELESGSRRLAAGPGAESGDMLAGGQKFLDANQPQKALAIFEQFLAAQPDHAEALVLKAAALEKLGRLDEALADCDQAIAHNRAFTPALVQKGGLLNKLNRHAEAIDCFEQALLAREQKAQA
jgi:tetratricopeptide (TPR) repeat protein